MPGKRTKAWALVMLAPLAVVAACGDSDSGQDIHSAAAAEAAATTADWGAGSLFSNYLSGVVSVPGTDAVVYESWQEGDQPAVPRFDSDGMPTLRLRDGSGDRLLVANAASPAVSRSGALAYVSGKRSGDSGTQFAGQVLVRSAIDAADEAWLAEPDTYMVAAWAGETLLVHRLNEYGRLEGLLLLRDGRVIAETSGMFKAASPDGRYVALSTYSADAIITVLDTETGNVVDRVPLSEYAEAFIPEAERVGLDYSRVPDPTEEDPLPVTYTDGAGVWLDSTMYLGGARGLLVFNADGGDLTASRLVPFPAVESHIIRQPGALRTLDDGQLAFAVVDLDAVAADPGPPPERIEPDELDKLAQERAERYRSAQTSRVLAYDPLRDTWQSHPFDAFTSTFRGPFNPSR